MYAPSPVTKAATLAKKAFSSATKTVVTLPLLLILGLGASPAGAQNQPKTWLRGLGSVKVNVSISKVLVDAGVPGAQLRTQTELQLRQAGLIVDPNATDASFTVEIVACRGTGTNNYAAVVHVSAIDTVKVLRNDEAITTPIRGPDLYVLYLVRDIPNTVLDTTKARVDAFLNDWLAANPRGLTVPSAPAAAPPPAAPTAQAAPKPSTFAGAFLQALRGE